MRSRTRSTRHQRGRFLAWDGQLDEGLRHLDEAIVDRSSFHGPDHPRTWPPAARMPPSAPASRAPRIPVREMPAPALCIEQGSEA
ncbi:tetratricopeptide repeat protein [Streptomyces sp. NPDC054765]